MGEVTTLQDVDMYDLTDVLRGTKPGTLVLIGEHCYTGEVILERVTIRCCGTSMLN